MSQNYSYFAFLSSKNVKVMFNSLDIHKKVTELFILKLVDLLYKEEKPKICF